MPTRWMQIVDKFCLVRERFQHPFHTFAVAVSQGAGGVFRDALGSPTFDDTLQEFAV